MRKEFAFLVCPLLMIWLFFKAKSDFHWDETLQGCADIALMILISFMVGRKIYDEVKKPEQK